MHVHFGSVHQFGSYYLNGIEIDSVESQKDLGILFDHQLKFHLHTTDITAKANRLLGDVSIISILICWLNYLLLWFILH